MTFEKIKTIIAEQLNINEDRIALDTNLMKDLEADSIEAVEIIMGIEDEFDIEIPDEKAETFQSVEDIVKFVDSMIA